jgi:hypothetical protein
MTEPDADTLIYLRLNSVGPAKQPAQEMLGRLHGRVHKVGALVALQVPYRSCKLACSSLPLANQALCVHQTVLGHGGVTRTTAAYCTRCRQNPLAFETWPSQSRRAPHGRGPSQLHLPVPTQCTGGEFQFAGRPHTRHSGSGRDLTANIAWTREMLPTRAVGHGLGKTRGHPVQCTLHVRQAPLSLHKRK